jgi:hypothetical protein
MISRFGFKGGELANGLSVFHAGGEVGERGMAACCTASLGMRVDGQCTAPGHQGEAPSQERIVGVLQSRICGGLWTVAEGAGVGFGAVCGQEKCARGRTGLPGAFRFAMSASAGIVRRRMGRWSLMRRRSWNSGIATDRLQRMAECFVLSYVEKRKRQNATPRAS